MEERSFELGYLEFGSSEFVDEDEVVSSSESHHQVSTVSILLSIRLFFLLVCLDFFSLDLLLFCFFFWLRIRLEFDTLSEVIEE